MADISPAARTSAPGRRTDYLADTSAALAVMGAHGQTGRVPASARQARADSAVAALIGPPPAVASVTSMAMPGPGGPLTLRVYRPAGDEARRAGLVYFHGGGFVTGGPDSHREFLRALANGTGHVVVAVDYRLAPEPTG